MSVAMQKWGEDCRKERTNLWQVPPRLHSMALAVINHLSVSRGRNSLSCVLHVALWVP